MAFFPTSADITADDLYASWCDGGIDLPDAIRAALRADGIDPDTAPNVHALVYRIVRGER